NIPARCEAGLIQNHGPFAIGDDTVTMTDNEMTGCLGDINAMAAVGRVADDPRILLVEGIHGVPGEGNPFLQLARVCGQVNVSPRSSRRALLACLDGIPRCESKIRMVGRVLGTFESVWRDVGIREIGHGIAARLEEQEDVLAVCDPVSTETYAHASTQWLNVQQSLR